MAHQHSRVGFNSSVEVNEINLSLSYGGVIRDCEAGYTPAKRAKHWTKFDGFIDVGYCHHNSHVHCHALKGLSVIAISLGLKKSSTLFKNKEKCLSITTCTIFLKNA